MTLADLVVSLDSEEKVWSVIEDLRSGAISAENVELDLSEIAWARFNFKLEGKNFHQSLTSQTMLGLVDYQNALYRSISLLLHGDAHFSKLTNEEKILFQLSFVIREGSSDIEGDGKETLKALALKLAGKLSKNQLFIGFLLISSLYFGKGMLANYWEHDEKKAEDSRRHELTLAIMRHDERMLARNNKEPEIVGPICQHNRDGVDAILRKSGEASSVRLQGRSVSKKELRNIRLTPRRQSSETKMKEKAKILSVDSSNDDGFIVKLKLMTGKTIDIEMFDPSIIERYRDVLSKAEWDHSTVLVEFTGRKVGDSICDTRLIKVERTHSG